MCHTENNFMAFQKEAIKDLDLCCFISDLNKNIIHKNDFALNMEKELKNICCEDILKEALSLTGQPLCDMIINDKEVVFTNIDDVFEKIVVKKIHEQYILFTAYKKQSDVLQKNDMFRHFQEISLNYKRHIYRIYNMLAPISQALDEFGDYEDFKYVNTISSNCHQVLKSTTNIQKLYQFEHGTYISETAPLSLRLLCRNITKDVSHLLTGKNVELNVSICQKELICNACEEDIRILLLNVISNSVFFSKRTEQITKIDFILDEIGDSAIITIKDNGIGIKTQDLHKVFDNFYSLDYNVEIKKGLGIGLSVAKKIANYYGGNIVISSVENQGTTVKIKLPKTNLPFSHHLRSPSTKPIYGGLTMEMMYLSDCFEFSLF